MKNILKVLAGILIVATTLLSAESIRMLNKKDLAKVQKEFPKLLDPSYIKLVKGVDHGKITQIEAKNLLQNGDEKIELFTVDSVKGIIFVGNAYGTNAKPIKIPKDIELIKNGVAFTVGTGKENLYIVTDPECKYCVTLEKSITKEVLEKYTINIILFPLSFHNNAIPMLHWVLAAKTKPKQAKRFHEVLMGDLSYKSFKVTKEERNEADKVLLNSKRAARELGIRGTPSVFNSDFNQIRGF